MNVTKWETLYYEYHGATLKHKCGRRIVAVPLLSFSLIFLLIFFIWAFSIFDGLFFFARSLIPTCGGIIVSIILSSLGQCSNNDDHHTSFYFQLKNYNSILRTRYDSIWMPSAVYRDVQWSSIANDIKKRTSHENIMLAILRSCKAIWQWWCVS